MSQCSLYTVLLAPHVSEKGASHTARDTYVFKVRKDASKWEIAKAVEKYFKVTVEKVRTVVVKGKTVRFKQRPGKHSDWKKAYVQLKEGDAIEIAGSEQ